MVLRLMSYSPRRSGFFVTVIPEKIASHELDASIEASGPHDFAVRIQRCSSKAPTRPPHPAPTSVTIAKRPSVWDGTAVDIKLIWVRRQAQFRNFRNPTLSGAGWRVAKFLPPRASCPGIMTAAPEVRRADQARYRSKATAILRLVRRSHFIDL